MLRRSVLLLFLFGCATTKPAVVNLPTVAYPFSRTVLEREDVTTCADRILALSWYGQVDWERAAFLHLADDGRFTCDVWPAKLQFRKAEWSGAIPVGTVALIHSHPRTLPDPSSGDTSVAKHLHIPVIVVTPESIVMIQPSDGTLLRVPAGTSSFQTSVHHSSAHMP